MQICIQEITKGQCDGAYIVFNKNGNVTFRRQNIDKCFMWITSKVFRTRFRFIPRHINMCYRVLLFSHTIMTSSSVGIFEVSKHVYHGLCGSGALWYIVDTQSNGKGLDFLSSSDNTTTINNTGFLFFCKTVPFGRGTCVSLRLSKRIHPLQGTCKPRRVFACSYRFVCILGIPNTLGPYFRPNPTVLQSCQYGFA